MKNDFPEKLVDPFGRTVDYVRISVTDRCDFRCVYCMDEKMQFLPRARILTLEEIALIAKSFVELGIKKIRLTGGEPLVRKNVMELIEELGQLESLEELTLTTNGSQLEHMSTPIREAGVKRINVSLDSLDEKRFKTMTRTGQLQSVLRGINSARRAGFNRIKINSVILKNRNDDEVIPLVKFAIEKDLDISFIEEMPLGLIGDHDRAEMYCSSDEIKNIIARSFSLVPTTETTGGPSKYYKIPGVSTKVGFISPHSHNFCGDCNRVRLTVEGRLLLCLGQENSVDLKEIVRRYPGDLRRVKKAIVDSIAKKPLGHDFKLDEKPVIFRHMSHTGG
jgi:cyclic pyranopterin phosphate synthase